MKDWSKTSPPLFLSASHNILIRAFKKARSPLILTGRYKSCSLVASPTHSQGFWGCRKRIKPASGKGLTAIIFPPFFFKRCRAVSILGELVPAFWPMLINTSASSMSFRVTEALPIPRVSLSAFPLASWHILEQSGRLLVPNCLTKHWYRNAASLLVLPEV